MKRSQLYRKPIIFAEAPHPPTPTLPEAQAKAYSALLSAFYTKPWFAEVFWWKLFTNGLGGRQDNTMTPCNKPAMDIIKRWYQTSRADPSPTLWKP